VVTQLYLRQQISHSGMPTQLVTLDNGSPACAFSPGLRTKHEAGGGAFLNRLIPPQTHASSI
jgi:hypothetical protein